MNKSGRLLVLFLVFTYNLAAQQETYTVNSINITGNKRTKTSILIREMAIKTGDFIKEEDLENKINRSKNNLINLNLFNDVNISTEKALEGFLTVNVKVTERWYLVGIPEVLLADRSFNEWWYDRGRDFSRLSYGVNIKHFNLTGNNDQLRLRLNAGFLPYYELSYNKPYIDKRKRIGIRTSLVYSTAKSMPYRTWNDKLDFIKSEDVNRKRFGAFFELRLRNALYHFHSINLGYSDINISDQITTLNPYYLNSKQNNLKLFSFLYDYRYDLRDNRQYPLKGQFLQAQLGISGAKDFKTQATLQANYSYYKPWTKKIISSISLKTRLSLPHDQAYVLTRGLGYDGALVRGYELYVIDGQNFLLERFTTKYKLLERTFDLSNFITLKQFNKIPLMVFPNVFFDAGGVKNYFPERSNSKLGNKLLTGGGLGLDFITWYNTNFKIYLTKNNIGQNGFFFGLQREY